MIISRASALKLDQRPFFGSTGKKINVLLNISVRACEEEEEGGKEGGREVWSGERRLALVGLRNLVSQCVIMLLLLCMRPTLK